MSTTAPRRDLAKHAAARPPPRPPHGPPRVRSPAATAPSIDIARVAAVSLLFRSFLARGGGHPLVGARARLRAAGRRSQSVWARAAPCRGCALLRCCASSTRQQGLRQACSAAFSSTARGGSRRAARPRSSFSYFWKGNFPRTFTGFVESDSTIVGAPDLIEGTSCTPTSSPAHQTATDALRPTYAATG